MNKRSTNMNADNNCKNVTKEMLVGNLIKYCPETISMLMDHGINSFATHVVRNNTIEQAASSEKIDVGKLIYDMNNRMNNRYGMII